MLKKIIEKLNPKPTSIDELKEKAFPLLSVPFNGTNILCKVRCLNDTQIKSLGDFSLIDISTDTNKKQLDNSKIFENIIKTKNFQEKLVKETLIEPAFDDIQKKIYGEDSTLTDKLNRLEKLNKKIKKLKIEDQKEVLAEIESIELFTGYLLPTDFMSTITAWALGVDRSDIKKLTRDMLLEAAMLAERGHDNPADHIKGEFTSLHVEEINKTAWIVYNQFMEDKQKEKELGKKFRIIKGNS
jgi:hypothetical protein